MKRVRYRKQKPMALEETWMPLALFPDLTWQVMENSKYHFIEEEEWLSIVGEQEIIPLMPTEEMSRHSLSARQSRFLKKYRVDI